MRQIQIESIESIQPSENGSGLFLHEHVQVSFLACNILIFISSNQCFSDSLPGLLGFN
jgi:hypothetical protein